MYKHRINLNSLTPTGRKTILFPRDTIAEYDDRSVPTTLVLNKTYRDYHQNKANIYNNISTVTFIEGPYAGVEFLITRHSFHDVRPRVCVLSIEPINPSQTTAIKEVNYAIFSSIFILCY